MFLVFDLDLSNSYVMIIALCLIIILSYFFNVIAKKTNIPSVLLLILTGIGIKFGLDYLGKGAIDLFPILEVLGIIGLIMIVLEAALELELRRDKLPVILKSLAVAAIALLGSVAAITYALQQLLPEPDIIKCLLYATPLSVLSSAIIIPSVSSLDKDKKEFMVYESTFSDILGIMLFYFIVTIAEANQTSELNVAITQASIEFITSLVLTIIVSVIASYLLVLILQKIPGHVKFFLLIAILILLYSVGKLIHLSPLLIILFFGVILANNHLFFRGPLTKFINTEKVHEIEKDMFTVTVETAFVVRTFFFVVFGMTAVLATLLDIEVVVISLVIIGILYIVRFITLQIFLWRKINPQLFIAPRGLITVLLFYAIPKDFTIEAFNPGVLLFVILVSALIMTFALIVDGKKRSRYKAIRKEIETEQQLAEQKAVTENLDRLNNEAPNPEDIGPDNNTQYDPPVTGDF